MVESNVTRAVNGLSGRRNDALLLKTVKVMRKSLLRIAFILTLPLALFWTLGFAFESFFNNHLPSYTGLSDTFIAAILLLLLYLVAFAGLMIAWKLSPNFMRIPPSTRLTRVGKIFVISAVSSYIVTAIISFLVSEAFVARNLDMPAERDILVALLTVWLPLWWVVPISSISTAILLNKKQTDWNDGR